MTTADPASRCLSKAPHQTQLSTHLKSHLIDPQLLRVDNFEGFVTRRQEALLELIDVATGKAIYRGVATDEPVEDMIEDKAEVLEVAE